MGVLKGHLDRINHREFVGWAHDPARPDRPVRLRILVNGRLLGRLPADQYRDDLAAAGFGDGRRGFRLRLAHRLAPHLTHTIQIQHAAFGSELPGSPVVLPPLAVPDADSAAWLTATFDALRAEATDGPARAALLRFLAGQLDVLSVTRPELAQQPRWQEARTALRAREGAARPAARAADDGTRHALFVDLRLPRPERDGGSNAALGHIGALQRLGYQVTFVAASEMARHGAAGAALTAAGVRLCHAPAYASVEEVLRLEGGSFDLAYLHRLPVAAQYMALVRAHCPRARVLYSVADLHFLREARQAAVQGDAALAARSRRTQAAELLAAHQADAVITHSTHEAALLRRALPGQAVHVVPWPAAAQPRRVPFAARSGLAFVAGFGHPPNLDAAHWLITAILPLLRAAHPNIVCLLVGSDLPPHFARGVPGVTVLGHVPDLASVYDRVRLTVAPLRFGAGLKQKMVESLAAGLPCVATSIGAEGMELPPSLAALVADDPAGIVRLILDMHDDPTLNAMAAEAGLQHVWRRFAAPRIDALLRAATAPTEGNATDIAGF